MSMVRVKSEHSSTVVNFLAWVGDHFTHMMEFIGGISFLSRQIIVSIIRDPFDLKGTVSQIEVVGIKSSSLTNLIAIFTGMVLAVQFIVSLKRFGLQLYTGQIIGLAITRELGPVLTSLMVAARVGSGITAEIGSMKVTEQVSAIEAMGGNPIQKLVVPRVIATALCVPVLTIVADIIGILGGMMITILETGISARYYFDQITHSVEIMDVGSGMAKTFFFGFFIGVIACFQGLHTTGGTEGVGKATTFSVVYSSICIFISDFFLTKLFLML